MTEKVIPIGFIFGNVSLTDSEIERLARAGKVEKNSKVIKLTEDIIDTYFKRSIVFYSGCKPSDVKRKLNSVLNQLRKAREALLLLGALNMGSDFIVEFLDEESNIRGMRDELMDIMKGFAKRTSLNRDVENDVINGMAGSILNSIIRISTSIKLNGEIDEKKSASILTFINEIDLLNAFIESAIGSLSHSGGKIGDINFKELISQLVVGYCGVTGGEKYGKSTINFVHEARQILRERFLVKKLNDAAANVVHSTEDPVSMIRDALEHCGLQNAPAFR